MDYYDSDEDRFNEDRSNEEPQCDHDERYYDERQPFDKLAELVYETPHPNTSIDPAPQQHRRIAKTLLDEYMSDSDDSYTEEEMLDYAKRGNYFEAALLEKAEMGDTDACYEIGTTYETGGLSMHKAVLWYERAAEKGHVKSQAALGNIYEDGIKTRSPYSRRYEVMFNEEKALKWYQKAFENGNMDAAFNIGDTYRVSENPNQNYVQKAVEWYLKAFHAGIVKAGEAIGDMYEGGIGVERDYDLAKEWYVKSYEKGHLLSAVKMAHLYSSDEWDEQNCDTAEDWIQKAYAVPDSEVAFRIAKYYEDHYGSDNENTLKWYYKAGLSNHDDSLDIIYDRDYELSTELKREVIYEHYTHELHSDIEKQAKQIKSLEEQLEAKDYMIAALQKKLTDGNAGGTETENAM